MMIFYVYNSKHCKLQDFRDLYYSYTVRDFFKLLEFIYQKEALEEVVQKDAEASTPKHKGNLDGRQE